MHQSLSIFCLLQLSIVLSVDGVSMTINPSSMVVGSISANPVTRLECRCSSDGTDNIRAAYGLEISIKRCCDSDFVIIAQMDWTNITRKFPLDVILLNVTGSLVPVAGGEYPTVGKLIVTMDVGGLTCRGHAEFRCMLVYTKMGSTAIGNVSHVNNFTVIFSGESEKTTIQPGASTIRSDGLAIVLGVLLGACVVLLVIMSVCLHRYRKLAELQPHPQNDNLIAYDRLHTTVGHSETT